MNHASASCRTLEKDITVRAPPRGALTRGGGREDIQSLETPSLRSRAVRKSSTCLCFHFHLHFHGQSSQNKASTYMYKLLVVADLPPHHTRRDKDTKTLLVIMSSDGVPLESPTP